MDYMDMDTGASYSCMSLSCYEKLSLPLVKQLVGTTVWSATGSNLDPLGVVECHWDICNLLIW